MGFFRKLLRRSAPAETAAPEQHADDALAVALGPASSVELELEADAAAILANSEATTLPLPENTPPPAAHVELDGTNTLSTHQLRANVPLAVTSVTSDRPLALWAVRDIGRVRRSNQDSVHAMLVSLPELDHDQTLALAVVADGMGGHTGGEIASRRAIETVMLTLLEYVALPAMANESPGVALPLLLVTAIQEANQRIWAEGQEHGTDMGTTCSAALIVGDQLYLGHVGDSRAYLLYPSGLRQISTDHSTVGRLISMGQLTEEDAREHPLRNQLYRTVGQQPNVEVDFSQHELTGVSHLLLCSDGLWGMIDDAEIETIIRESPFPRDACQRLIARANLAGGEDNISAVVVSFPTELRAL